MADRLALFADRRDAGRKLAAALDRFRIEDPLVLALPRGGVPVGYEVARALEAPLDILLVRKLGAPLQPEYGIGAIAEGGVRVIRSEDLELIGMGEAELDAIVARETEELDRRALVYRGEREALPVEGRTVILVDDGIATGGTAVAAGRVLRARGAARVILARSGRSPRNRGPARRRVRRGDLPRAAPLASSASASSTSTSDSSTTSR